MAMKRMPWIDKIRMHQVRCNCVDFHRGNPDSSVVAILECPGKAEERDQHPAAGPTGLNLSTFCDILKDRNSEAYQDIPFEEERFGDFYYDRSMPTAGMMVANACRTVHYKNAPNGKDIDAVKDNVCQNAKELAYEIADKVFVLCLGHWANKVYDLMSGELFNRNWKERQIVVRMNHFSNTFVNSNIKLTCANRLEIRGRWSGPKAREKRIEVFVRYFLERVVLGRDQSFSEYLTRFAVR